MTCHIVTESPMDVLALQWLLQPEIACYGKQIWVRGAGGLSAAASLSQTILARRQEPVACLVHADTTDARKIREDRHALQLLLSQVALFDLFAILFFVPTIEALLFRDEALLQAVCGSSLSEAQRTRAREDPKGVLSDLAAPQGLSLDDVWQRAMTQSPDVVRTAPPIPELIDFVTQVLRPEGVAPPA